MTNTLHLSNIEEKRNDNLKIFPCLWVLDIAWLKLRVILSKLHLLKIVGLSDLKNIFVYDVAIDWTMSRKKIKIWIRNLHPKENYTFSPCILNKRQSIRKSSSDEDAARLCSTNNWIVQINSGNDRKKLPRQYENILTLLPGQSSTLHFSVRKDGPVHALPPFVASIFWVLVMFLAPVPHGLGHSPMIHLFQTQSTIKGYNN